MLFQLVRGHTFLLVTFLWSISKFLKEFQRLFSILSIYLQRWSILVTKHNIAEFLYLKHIPFLCRYNWYHSEISQILWFSQNVDDSLDLFELGTRVYISYHWYGDIGIFLYNWMWWWTRRQKTFDYRIDINGLKRNCQCRINNKRMKRNQIIWWIM